MFQYSLSNLFIHSEIEIPYLLSKPLVNNQILQISLKEIKIPKINSYYSWLEDDLSPRVNFYKEGENIYLEYPNTILFQISGDCIYAEPKIKEAYYYQHLLTDQVIPLYLSQNNLVIHASAFTYQNYNLILLGKSGSGKSSLVNQFYPQGKFIADDFVIFDIRENSLDIIPTYPGIRLIDQSNQKNVCKVPEKFFLLEKNNNHNIIICLNRKTAIPTKKFKLITPSPEEVYQQLLSELIQLFPDDPVRQLNLFANLNRLLKSSTLLELQYSDLLGMDFKSLMKKTVLPAN